MEKTTLKVLLIEDTPGDAEFVRECLTDSRLFHFDIVSVDRLSAAIDALKTHVFDIALTDLGLPDCCGKEAYAKLHEAAPQPPVIILSGNANEDVALDCVMSGAQDYLVKGTFNAHTLQRAIRYAIERRRIENFKDDFASMVSHELRAPLSVVKGALDGIREISQGTLGEKQTKLFDLACKNANRLAKIISNILNLSRLESGNAVVNLTGVDAKALAEEAAFALRSQAASPNVRLLVEASPHVALVRADPDLLAEVFYNLVSNGLRFAKTALTITIAPADQAVLERVFQSNGASPHPDENFAHICVADDGPGIQAERLKDLFNKFMQLGRKTGGSDYKGTGLGLSISKRIVELLGGRIWAESEIGRGAKFHFVLPQA